MLGIRQLPVLTVGGLALVLSASGLKTQPGARATADLVVPAVGGDLRLWTDDHSIQLLRLK